MKYTLTDRREQLFPTAMPSFLALPNDRFRVWNKELVHLVIQGIFGGLTAKHSKFRCLHFLVLCVDVTGFDLHQPTVQPLNCFGA